MIGSIGPRMLEATLPHVASWNVWFEDYGNDPAQVPALLARLGAACDEAGRDYSTLEKTLAHLVQFGDSPIRRNSSNPNRGSDEEVADRIGRIMEAGVDHLQLVLDPITSETVEHAASIVNLVRSR